MIVIDFLGIPKGQKRPRFGRGHAYKAPESRAHEDSLGWTAKVTMNGRKPLQGTLMVSVDAYFPVPKSWSKRNRAAALIGEIRPATKPDCDNIVKTALDSMNNIVYLDDKQVVECSVHKYYSDKPSLHIEVTEL